MALWGSVDNAANSTISTAQQVNQSVSTANRTALFNNVTTGAFIAGANVGVFGVSETEAGNASSESVAHAGWILRTEGTGGRAGRVHNETLVAMSSITGDAAANTDNTPFPGV